METYMSLFMLNQHNLYTRKAEHVLCDVPITFTGATLGTEIEIPMVDGTKKNIKFQKVHKQVQNLQ